MDNLNRSHGLYRHITLRRSIARLSMGLAVLFGWAGVADAVPPKAPSNVRAEVSHRISGPIQSKASLWLVTWEDLSDDEAGFLVRVRTVINGARSPFFLIDGQGAEPANSEGTVFSLNAEALPPGARLEFEVAAFKNNGTKVETSKASNLGGATVPSSETWGAPSNLVVVVDGDGTIVATWQANANTAVRYEVLARKTGNTTWLLADDPLFGVNPYRSVLRLEPSTSYDFSVRAVRFGSSGVLNEFTAQSNVVTVEIPPLAPPTNLTATVLSEDRIRLNWEDQSVNGMGYEVQYRFDGETDFRIWDYTAPGAESFEIIVPPGATIEWRVLTAFQAVVSGPIVTSVPSNVVSVTTDFRSPTNLQAVRTGMAGGFSLTWEDPSDVAQGFEVLGREAGTENAFTQLAVVKKTTALIQELPVGVPQELVVRALSADTVSPTSNIVTVQPLHGFTNRLYEPIAEDAPFSLTIGTSDDPDPLEEPPPNFPILTIEGLPPGIEFDPALRTLSGTPTEPGVFNVEMHAEFEDMTEAEVVLTLRVVPSLKAPVVDEVLTDRTVGVGTVLAIPLQQAFNDPDTPRAVRIETSFGDVDVALFDDLTPLHVANFMSYVSAGDYDGVAIHRSSSSFFTSIVQTGAFRPTTAPNVFVGTTKRPSVANEPGVSNLRGTIAAAKTDLDPDSATHDFFFNLADNSLNLDNQNGGFTVFARVAGNGLDVMDQIVSLPIADYEIVVDGIVKEPKEWPMNDVEAPAEMDISKIVVMEKVHEIPPISHHVSMIENPNVLSAVVEDGVLKITGLIEGTSSVTLTGTDLDGNTVEQTLTIAVDPDQIHPTFVTQPLSQDVLPGAAVSITVEANGTVLEYEWSKNGQVIPSVTGPSLLIPANSAVQEVEGTYRVRIFNATDSVISEPAVVRVRAAPSVVTGPQARLIGTGESFQLGVTVTGMPTPAVSWLKNNRLLSSTAGLQLGFQSASLADFGVYRARVSNSDGKVLSLPAAVAVVQTGDGRVVVRPGQNAVLQAVAKAPAGVALSFQWFKREGETWEEVTDELGKISGSSTSRLSVRNVSFIDGKTYRCEVSAFDPVQKVLTGSQDLIVAAEPDLESFSLPPTQVGLAYDFQVPFASAKPLTPTQFVARGLPPGLRIDAATGRIHGAATRRGTYAVRVQAFNAAGASDIEGGTLTVASLEANTTGVFVGLFSRQQEVNGSTGGRMDLTITDNAAFSGLLFVEGRRSVFRGSATWLSTGVLAGEVTIKRGRLEPYVLRFEVNPLNGLMSGYLRFSGEITAELIGWKNVWHATYAPTTFLFDGRYSFGMKIQPEAESFHVPKGGGFVRLDVAKSGRSTLVGRTVDGQVISMSAPLGPAGQFIVYQMLYRNTGSLLGPLLINRVSATQTVPAHRRIQNWGSFSFNQFKRQQPSGERVYPEGFAALRMDVTGGGYTPPDINTRIMGLTADDNDAILEFSEGGLGGSDTDPDVVLTLDGKNRGSLPALGSVGNPGRVTWKFNGKTGGFSGRGTLKESDGTTRSFNYEGQLIPVSATLYRGVGYFSLAQLPEGEQTIKTSPILFGRVDLQPNPPVP